MAFLSSKLMCLRSILRLNCKALLWLPAATTAHNIPRCALEFSTFNRNARTKHYLEPASLFSTVSKTTKKKEEKKEKVSNDAKNPLEKKKRELYTEKQDQLILDRVQEMGYDNPETWKSLAKDFNMTNPACLSCIRQRYHLLLRRGTGKRQIKRFTEEEDALILKRVEEMGYGNIKTWTTLAIELDRDPTFYKNIKRRYDLIINRDTKEIKRFTEEESNYIQTYVENNGQSKTTWQELAIKFDKDRWTIEHHHHKLLENYTKGKFTKAEDNIILNDVKIHGNNLQTFKGLCKKLNRRDSSLIRNRCEYLQNQPSQKPGPWQIEEDQMLMEHFFKDNPNNMNDLNFLESSKPNDFDQISADIGRSKDACHRRWKIYIVPVLKTDIHGMPQNVEWKKDVLRYIIEMKFGSFKEIPYHKVVEDICPGQTSYSLSIFLNNISRRAGKIPFHECCLNQLKNPHANSHLGNEELVDTKSEHASKILEIKQKLK